VGESPTIFKNKFGGFKILSYICSMKKKDTKVEKPKQVVEYFTDEMAKSIFLFQDKLTYSSKASVNPITLSKRKK
jgi:hypothetical protein